jgi:gliding motility-associated lipoprotein GldD
MIRRFFFFLIVISVLSACGDEKVFLPKPRSYPKVEYPSKAYQMFSKDYCNMSFEFPVYANVERDTSFFEGKPNSPCWFNLLIPQFNCYLYCSYSEIRNSAEFSKLIDDAFVLAYEHDKKANYIEDALISNENGLGGIEFSLSGPAATPYQFFITDTTSNFLRASLYFKTKVQPDSLKPIIDFVKLDMKNLIRTFKFNKTR